MRSQAKKEDKPVKPLKVADRVDISVGRDQLIEMQQEDETLKKILQRVIEKKQNVTFRDLTLLDIVNLCPAVLIMNFLFV